MGRRLNHSTPTVINTELIPFDESFFIEADGQLEQWYYDNTTQYAPNRKITPLTLTPKLSVFDSDTQTSYSTDASTIAFYTVTWYALEYSGTTGDYVETVITNVTDSASADYVLSGNNLIVKKNVSYSHGVTIRCVATYIDPRDAGITYTTEDTVLLTTNRDAKVTLPEATIISPSARSFNPLLDYNGQGVQQSQFEFKAALSNNPERAESEQVQEYKMDGYGTEELLYDNGMGVITCSPTVSIRYPDGSEETNQEFMYRQTADGTKKGVSGTAYVTDLKGKTVVFNQLVVNGNFSNGTTGWTNATSSLSVSDGIGTFTKQANKGTSYGACNATSSRGIQGHRYYVAGTVRTAEETTVAIGIGFNTSASYRIVISSVPTTFQRYSKILSPLSEEKAFYLQITTATSSNTLSVQARELMAIDLTTMFGDDDKIAAALGITTADITTTTGVAAFESWLARNVGAQSYYEPYNGFVSVKSSFIKTVGFNLWDGTVSETGKYLNANGTTTTSTNNAAITNFIRVLPNTDYYMSVKGSATAICFYDELHNFISGIRHSAIPSTKIVTTPAGACYVKNTIPNLNTDGATYCFNISNASKNGQYEVGWSRTATLPVTTMTGKLNGAGSSVTIFSEGMRSVNGVCDEVTNVDGVLKAIKRVKEVASSVGRGETFRKEGDLYTTPSISSNCWNMVCNNADFTPMRWYQLIQSPCCDDVTKYTVASADNTLTSEDGYGVLTIGKTTAGSNTISISCAFAVKNRYLITVEAKLASNLTGKTFMVGQMSAAGAGRTSYYASANLTTEWQRLSVVTPAYGSNPSYNGIVRLGLRSTIAPAGAVIHFRNFNVINLTAIYGAGNEPTKAEFFARFTEPYYQYLSNGLAFLSGTTYETADAFRDAFNGEGVILGSMDTPQVYTVDDYSIPTNFVWFGMNGSTETRAEQLPYYVSGQGTDTLVVDAMWSENINIVLRCTKNSATDELSPSKSYASLTWRVPDMDTNIMSKNGGAVRSDSTSFDFDTICNMSGTVLTDTVKNTHLRFNWKRRKSDTTTEVDLGWGGTKTIAASDLLNARGVSGKLPSTHVYSYAYLLGAWEPQTSADTLPSGYTELDYIESSGTQSIDTGYVVTGNDNDIYADITFLGYSNNTTYISWFSAYTGENYLTYRIIRNGSTNNSILLYNCTKANGGSVSFSIAANTRYSIALLHDYTYVINGITGTLNYVSATANTGTMKLFRAGTGSARTIMRVHSFRIVKNGTEVLNLVPAMRDSDSVVGLYDVARNTFLTNDGTGTFTYGKQMTYNKPTTTKNGVTYVRKIPTT